MATAQAVQNGRILTIEHPTESQPVLLVFSSNAGQLLRGDRTTANVLTAMKQSAHRKGVPFVMHFQEAGAGIISEKSVGMTRLLEDVFGHEITIFRHGTHESIGQIREGLDQYLASAKSLPVRARSVVHLSVVERRLMRQNQRAAMHTSYDFPLPDGEQGYLLTSGFHYDLGLTSASKRISRLQAEETRQSVERLLQREIDQDEQLLVPARSKPVRGRKGLIIFSGDGNTHAPIGTRWQVDQVAALKQGFGAEIKEATESIEATANLSHSIQQELIEKKHPLFRLAEKLIEDVVGTVDSMTSSNLGERKLDHQFYRDFTIMPDGSLSPLHAFEVIENNVFYGFGNADHYVISTLFGYRSTSV